MQKLVLTQAHLDLLKKTTFIDDTGETNASGVVGVGWSKSRQKWESYISIKGKKIRLGYFDKKLFAVEARFLAEQNTRLPRYRMFSTAAIFLQNHLNTN